MRTLKVVRVRDVKMPTRGTKGSAGIDFFVPNDFPGSMVAPNSGIKIPAGVKVKMDPNCALIAFNKSGIATKNNLQVGACVVDSDYQGELHFHLFNVGHEPQEIVAGMKLTQFIILEVGQDEIEELPNELDLFSGIESERGEGGFGSTGIQ
ncbi:MAG: dUTP diphosphatase [Fusobacteriaceae bacterium]